MTYKDVIIFGVGVAVGALGTWKFFKKRSEEQISSMENVLKNCKPKSGVEEGNNDYIFDEQPKKEEIVKGVEKETSSIDMDDLKKSGEMIQYNGYSSSSPEMVALAEKEHPTEVDPNEPYLIDQEEWEEVDGSYDKVEVSIYDDGAIVNENINELLDADCIGMQNLKLFLENDPNATVMYVRNKKLMTDYEVAKTYGRYTEMEGL